MGCPAEGTAGKPASNGDKGKGLENTIEHILPQNPDRRQYWTSRFDKKARRKYTNDMGNLCLTYNNSAYGNKPFPEKRGHTGQEKPCYANSNLFQERRLSRLEDWNIQELEMRRKEIVEWALLRWRVDHQMAPSVPDPEEIQRCSLVLNL